MATRKIQDSNLDSRNAREKKLKARGMPYYRKIESRPRRRLQEAARAGGDVVVQALRRRREIRRRETRHCGRSH